MKLFAAGSSNFGPDSDWTWWNRTVWYRARRSKERGRRILEERYNLEDALMIATFLNSFVNNTHIVKIANMAQLVNVIASIFTNDKGLFLQTIYHPLEPFANNSKGKALDLFVECPITSSSPNPRDRARSMCLRLLAPVPIGR